MDKLLAGGLNTNSVSVNHASNVNTGYYYQASPRTDAYPVQGSSDPCPEIGPVKLIFDEDKLAAAIGHTK